MGADIRDGRGRPAELVIVVAALLGACDPGPDGGATAAYRIGGGCIPLTDAPQWTEEGELLTVGVGCQDRGVGAAGDADRPFEVTELPPGATYDAATRTVSWRPGFDQAGTHTFRVAVPGTRDALKVTVDVADRFDHPQNVPVTAPERYPEETGLAVLHLFTSPGMHFERYADARVIYGGRVHAAKAKLRGNSSRAYPKKNFSVEFPAGALFGDGTRGFAPRRRIALTTTFDDNSHVRQRLSYEAWNRVGRGSVPIQHMSTVLYLDGQYHGLYTITDHIDADLMHASGLDRAGNLYKAVGPGANFFPKVPLAAMYEKKEGPRDDFGDLAALMQFVNDADAPTFRRDVGAWIAVEDYRAWMIAATAIVAEDTLGKNAYHHHQPGERWRVIPWDFNHSWGQAWDTARVSPTKDPTALARQNRLFGRLLDDEVLGPDTRDRYAAVLQNELSRGAVLELLDRYAAEVAPGAARDERRWRRDYLQFSRWSKRTDFTDFEGEIGYLRGWIVERWAYLARLLAPQGTAQ